MESVLKALLTNKPSLKFYIDFSSCFFSEAINLRRRQGRQANPDQSVTAAGNKITLPHISNNLWRAPSR